MKLKGRALEVLAILLFGASGIYGAVYVEHYERCDPGTPYHPFYQNPIDNRDSRDFRDNRDGRDPYDRDRDPYERDSNNRDYNRREEDRRLCNKDKGLICNPFSRYCECIVPGSIWSEGRCRAKVNYPCNGTPATVKIPCVQNAHCDNTVSYFCKCREGFESNEDGTYCSAGMNLKIPFMTIISLFILWSAQLL